MSLSRAEVEHIAELAKLNLTEAELDQYAVQLSAILDYSVCFESTVLLQLAQHVLFEKSTHSSETEQESLKILQPAGADVGIAE